MKKTIRLTESELKHMIMESVKRVLDETRISKDERGSLIWEPENWNPSEPWEDEDYYIGNEGSNGWPNLMNRSDNTESGYQICGWEELPSDKRRYSVWNSKGENDKDKLEEAVTRAIRKYLK